jgi:L,D-transpeptidase catalytic domain
MRRCVAFGLAVAFLFFSPFGHASVLVNIDKSHQRMTVSVDGQARHSWPVSTGRRGFGTPSGTFAPQRLARRWFSRKYYNSPMPYSIFFHGGFAIHGSTEIHRLGGPASHGCVRLHPIHAATLFGLVQRHGSDNTSIVVSGAIRVAAAPKPAPRWQPEPRPAPRSEPVRYRDEPPVYYRPVYRAPVYYYPPPVYYGPPVYYYYR